MTTGTRVLCTLVRLRVEPIFENSFSYSRYTSSPSYHLLELNPYLTLPDMSTHVRTCVQETCLGTRTHERTLGVQHQNKIFLK